MIQTNKTIQFCTVPLLIKFGFSRPDAYSTMLKMKNEYLIVDKKFMPNEKKNELPLEYVNLWLQKNMCTCQAITC